MQMATSIRNIKRIHLMDVLNMVHSSQRIWWHFWMLYGLILKVN